MKKVVVITGASSGIGLATARLLLSQGYRVYGIARREVAEPFECFRGDVNDAARIKEIFAAIKEREGRIDAVVNNAGMGIAGEVESASEEKIRTIFDTNLTSLAVISSLAIPYLRETGGNLVNLSSVAGELPIPFQSCYSATKAGVLNFSLALDGEVRRFGVHVTAILPGDTKTGFTAARVIEGDGSGYGGSVKRSIGRMEHDEQNGKSPDTVACAIARVLKKKRPPLRVTVGASYRLFAGLKRLLPTRFVNWILRKMYA